MEQTVTLKLYYRLLQKWTLPPLDTALQQVELVEGQNHHQEDSIQFWNTFGLRLIASRTNNTFSGLFF